MESPFALIISLIVLISTTFAGLFIARYTPENKPLFDNFQHEVIDEIEKQYADGSPDVVIDDLETPIIFDPVPPNLEDEQKLNVNVERFLV